MSEWDAGHYLRYGEQRTRAAEDLATRIQLPSPNQIVDLGCGPGNSTQVLKSRWPAAVITGIDSSPTMIAEARQLWPDQQWLLQDIVEWADSPNRDLVFSNAALQWIPDHRSLIPRLFSMVADGGALAFQIPGSTFARVGVLVHEISRYPAWSDRLATARSALTMEEPAFYYDVLAGCAKTVDIWETEYVQVMNNRESIIDWMASTGLRPFLTALDDSEQNRFLGELAERVADSYPSRPDGKVLFPFRRLFVIGYK